MVIPSALEPAFIHAIPGAEPDRRRLSRTAALAVAASVAAHVAVGYYVYQAKYGAAAAPTPADPPIITTFSPDLVIKPPPPKKLAPPPPHPLVVRRSTAPTAPAQATAPLTPVLARPLDLGQPPILARNIVVDPAPPQPAPPAIITSPDWLMRPGPNEFSRFYPQAALDRSASGMATLACTVSSTGAVFGCQVASETPSGLGFGDAARKLAPYFKMRPQLRDGAPVDGASIRIPIRFNLAA